MTISQRMLEAAQLRLRLQMNSRLRLEVLAAFSRVLREYHDPASDGLLSAIVLAVPEELVGEAQVGQGGQPEAPLVESVPVPLRPKRKPERVPVPPPPGRVPVPPPPKPDTDVNPVPPGMRVGAVALKPAPITDIRPTPTPRRRKK